MKAVYSAAALMLIVLSMTLINSTGIMETYRAPKSGVPTSNLTDGVTQLDSGSDESISSDLSGSIGFGKILGMIGTFFAVLIIPGPYMLEHGANIYAAALVQAVFNISLILAMIQLYLRFGLGEGNTV